jgi:hypothetical protein
MFFIDKALAQDWVYVPASRVSQNLGESTADQPTKHQIVGQRGKANISLNTATDEQLMQAGHIGPAFARDLINARPFGSWDEVPKISGIGEVRLANLQSLFYLPAEVHNGFASDLGPSMSASSGQTSSLKGMCVPGTVFKLHGKEIVVDDSELDCAASAISDSSFVSASSGKSMLSADGPRCFLPNTLLPCPPGNYQNVNNFKKGDVVLSAEGKELKIKVFKVHDVALQKCVELCAGDVTNCFTASHRVSVSRARTQQAAKAETLRLGDDIFTSGGETQKLDAIKPFEKEIPVYEFVFEPDDRVESFQIASGAILTHGRSHKPNRASHTRSHKPRSETQPEKSTPNPGNRQPHQPGKGPSSSIPDTDSDLGFA